MFWPQTAMVFLGGDDIGAMTDDGHHGKASMTSET